MSRTQGTRVAVRDDRVLGYTRGLSLFIAPFLLVAFVLLYLFPGDTARLFAWTIRPTLTPMVLASAYLGGFYFFIRVLVERHWSAVKLGFPPVALFAFLLGVATIIHWDRFNHGHVAFWLWAALYFTAPLLVTGAWFANRSYASPPRDDQQCIGHIARWVVGFVGLLAVVTGMVLFIFPGWVMGIWPWMLTPLTSRVVGAIFCLGSAGLGVAADPRWVTVRLMLHVEALMVVSMSVAVVRARDELYADRALTWLMLTGFVAVLIGSVKLWYANEGRTRRASDPGRAGIQ